MVKETNTKPPRFMIVLKDFKTDAQIQVGAAKMSDFLKAIEGEKGATFELERVINYFNKQVRKIEKTPKSKKTEQVQTK